MADYEDVSRAVIERIRPALPGWEMFWYPRSSHPVPAVRIQPDETKHAGYQEVPGMWYLRVGLHVDTTDEEAAYMRLSDLTDRGGPLISMILDDDPAHDALWDLCGLAIGVVDGRRWKPPNRRKRMSCDIGLTIGSG